MAFMGFMRGALYNVMQRIQVKVPDVRTSNGFVYVNAFLFNQLLILTNPFLLNLTPSIACSKILPAVTL